MIGSARPAKARTAAAGTLNVAAAALMTPAARPTVAATPLTIAAAAPTVVAAAMALSAASLKVAANLPDCVAFGLTRCPTGWHSFRTSRNGREGR